MPVTLNRNEAVLDGHIGIEDAGELHDWLKEQESATVDVRTCNSAHTAVIQLLLLTGPRILGASDTEDWRSLLLPGHTYHPAYPET